MRTSMQLVCSEEASSGIWRLRELASFLVLSFSYGNSVMIQFNCRFTILFSVVEREEGEMGERRENSRRGGKLHSDGLHFDALSSSRTLSAHPGAHLQATFSSYVHARAALLARRYGSSRSSTQHLNPICTTPGPSQDSSELHLPLHPLPLPLRPPRLLLERRRRRIRQYTS